MRLLCFIIASGLVLLMAPAGYSQGALETPLHINARDVILDEFGEVLRGNATAPGDLVQVLRADDGVIFPPAVDGRPHSSNPLMDRGTAGIGKFMPLSQTRPGKFGLSLGGLARPVESTKLFIRVFNAPTLAEASFYADSELLTVKGNSVLMAGIGRTTNALDKADDDGDGLNNSWEKSYESDPGNADTDGDGMLDGDEHLAGTSPTDEGSEFVVARISRGRLSWKSALGRRYQIQRADAAGGEYVNIGDVVDADPVLDETEIDIPDGAGSGMGFYRVKLVIE